MMQMSWRSRRVIEQPKVSPRINCTTWQMLMCYRIQRKILRSKNLMLLLSSASWCLIVKLGTPSMQRCKTIAPTLAKNHLRHRQSGMGLELARGGEPLTISLKYQLIRINSNLSKPRSRCSATASGTISTRYPSCLALKHQVAIIDKVLSMKFGLPAHQ